jgi:hypothetical protein
LTAIIDLFDTSSKSVLHNTEIVKLSSTEVKESLSLGSVLAGQKDVTFVVLKLVDTKGSIVSHNVYWVASNKDFKTLNSLSKTEIQVKVLKTSKGNNESKWTIRFANPGDKIAFFIHPQLVAGEYEVLPSYWSANYFTLAPKESLTVTVGCPPEKIAGRIPVLKVEGWNIGENVIPLILSK